MLRNIWKSTKNSYQHKHELGLKIGGNYINQIIGISSLLLVMVNTFVNFFIVSRFEKIVNEKLISVFSSIIAIILAGLSVQYVLDGINEFLV